jgi:carbohydrate-selective porin OprB
MSRNCWRKSTMNITTGMSVGNSRCWDSFEVYKVDMLSIVGFSASVTTVQLNSIMFQKNGQPENNHSRAHAVLFMKPLFQLTRSCKCFIYPTECTIRLL